MLLFLTACNSELAKLSPIRMTRVLINTSNEGTFDRIMVYATRTDGSHAFGRFNSSVVEINEEVPMGLYNFYGLAYNAMSIKKCSKATAYLSGSSNRVTLNFESATCADSEFLGNDPALNGSVFPAVTFPYTSIELCDSVTNITDTFDSCTDNLADGLKKHKRGHALSAKISLLSYDKVRGQYITGAEYGWGCQPVTPFGGTLRGLSISGVSNFAPAGDGSSTPFLMRFEFYPNSATCSGETPYIVDLPNGIVANNSKVKHVLDATPARKLYFKIAEDEICQGDNLTTAFAGGDGSYDSPKLICNESQFYSIFPTTNLAADYATRANYSYKLLSDIDLSDHAVTGSGFNPPWTSCVSAGSNFMPIGYTWDGTACATTSSAGMQFFGNDKTIKGMSIIRPGSFVGFYRSLDHAGGQASFIQNLKIADSTFVGTSYVGALVAQAQRTVFNNITFSNVSVQTTVSAFTGSIAGETLGGTITNVHGTGMTITGVGNVGGLVGQTSKADDGSMTAIASSSIRGDITGVSYVGGLVGDMGNLSANSLSTISTSSFVGSITADNIIGGLVGQTASTRIENSYARGDFTVTAAGNVRLGGLVGYATVRTGSGGIYSSYIMGSLSHSCLANDATCFMGTVIGSTDASSNATHYETVAYPSMDHISATTFTYGSIQTDTSFMSSNPGWVRPGPFSIMGSFSPTIWQFTDGANPSLVGEPNP